MDLVQPAQASRRGAARRGSPRLALLGLAAAVCLLGTGCSMAQPAKAAGDGLSALDGVCTTGLSLERARTHVVSMSLHLNRLRRAEAAGNTAAISLERREIAERSMRCFGTAPPSAAQVQRILSAVEQARPAFAPCPGANTYASFQLANNRDMLDRARASGDAMAIAKFQGRVARWEGICA
jgi:hypothetical protein